MKLRQPGLPHFSAVLLNRPCAPRCAHGYIGAHVGCPWGIHGLPLGTEVPIGAVVPMGYPWGMPRGSPWAAHGGPMDRQ